MSDWSRDDAIAMERRHIAEGEERIARQEGLLAELLKDGHEQLAQAATELLTLMRETLDFSRERLRDLEAAQISN